MTLTKHLIHNERDYRFFSVATPLCVGVREKCYLDYMNLITNFKTMELLCFYRAFTNPETTSFRVFTLQHRISQLQIPIAVLLTDSVLESRGFVPRVL